MLGGLGAVAFVKTWHGEKCVQLGWHRWARLEWKVTGGRGTVWGRGTVRGRGRTGPPMTFDHVGFCFML